MTDPLAPENVDDEESDDERSFPGTVPVGITIAYMRQQNGFEEKMIPRRLAEETETLSRTEKKSNSFQVFVESTAIYVLCLVLPTLLGYAYNLYDIWRYGPPQTGNEAAADDTSFWNYYVASSSYYQSFMNSVYEPSALYMCDDGGEDASYGWATLSSLFVQTGLCPPEYKEEASRSVLSDDVTAFSDTFIVAVLSLMLAVIRLVIVQRTVPMDDADALEAMIRSKSVHLLSSEYVVTPVRSRVASKRNTPPPEDQDISNDDLLFLPNLNEPSRGHLLNDVGLFLDLPEQEVESPVQMQTFATGAPLDLSAITSTPQAEDSKDELFGVVDADDDALIKKFAEAIPRSHHSHDDENHRKRLYAAPRYSTALFRLVYCTAAVCCALYYFRDADFWPWYVLGHGNTSQCWDLSGGLALGMDSDFDQHNAVLKLYFLGQASYHWHSGAFHILSMLVLLLHPTKHAPHRLLSFQKSTTAYVGRLGQHGLVIALIAGAYIFSSLRRLGAIGLFAFDVSSWFLHLLQLCVNAPESSRWSRSDVVKGILWYLVVPSFIATRFLIWPALWYSAAFESGAWLRQLEKTLWPGSAAFLLGIFHALMLVFECMSVVYFRRLFRHPHLHRVLSNEDVVTSESF